MQTSGAKNGSGRTPQGVVNLLVMITAAAGAGLFLNAAGYLSLRMDTTGFGIFLGGYVQILAFVGVVMVYVTLLSLSLPKLGWHWLVLALLLLPAAHYAPYEALVAELHVRVERPSLPSDWKPVHWKALPLGWDRRHHAPGFVADYVTPLAPDAAMASLRQAIGTAMKIRQVEGHVSPIAAPGTVQVALRPEGSATHVELGVFGNYHSSLPELMGRGGFLLILVAFIIAVARFQRRLPPPGSSPSMKL